MPIQLQILAILLALFFFIYTVRLVRSDKAEVRHMLKWLVLAVIILLGALFTDVGRHIAHLFGVTTLTSLSLFVLSGLLLVICLRYQISLVSADKQIRKLVQEVSLLKERLEDLENKQ